MKIKEQDSHHIVIATTRGDRIWGIVLLVIAVFLLTQIDFKSMDFKGAFLILPAIVSLYFAVRILIGKRVVFDNLLKRVVLEGPDFILIRRKRVISFVDVESVEIEFARINKGRYRADGWKVSLNTGDKMVKIDRTSSNKEMVYLAEEISKLMGIELKDKSAKPGWLKRQFM